MCYTKIDTRVNTPSPLEWKNSSLTWQKTVQIYRGDYNNNHLFEWTRPIFCWLAYFW